MVYKRIKFYKKIENKMLNSLLTITEMALKLNSKKKVARKFKFYFTFCSRQRNTKLSIFFLKMLRFLKDFIFLDFSSIFVTLLVFGYVAMIFVGPKFMEKREAFKLDRIMKIYNAIQVLLNGSLVIWV